METQFLKRPEWMDDPRREERWCDVRTVLARVGSGEHLGKSRDVSLGGLGLALKGAHPRGGEAVDVDVVFDTEVVTFRGRVAYSVPHPWGSLVGVALDGAPGGVREFLSRRYSPALGMGSVK